MTKVTKKIDYTLGDLEWIKILNNWRNCKGIKASLEETNMGLAIRDYSVPCSCPSHNKLMVIEGFWIWWCDNHNQPSMWCERDKLNIKIKELETKIAEVKIALNSGEELKQQIEDTSKEKGK